MEMRRSDSSGTDDDLPPSHSGHLAAARANRVIGNGKPGSNAVYHSTKNIDQLIRTLEQDAYTSVLRAFGAQSEHITWAKERLISDLRKELRVTDEQHRDFLAKVAGDDALRQIRQWRECGDGQQQHAAVPASSSLPNTAPPLHPSPPVPQSRKKQKTGAVSQVTMPPPAPVSKSTNSKKPAASVPRGKSKGGSDRNSGRGVLQTKRKEGTSEVQDRWVGQIIKTRWPDDNAFYEAYVKDFHKEDGTHTLVYDMGTENETSERVDLSKMAPEDIQSNGVMDRKPQPPKKNASSDKHQGTKKRMTLHEKPGNSNSHKWNKPERKASQLNRLVIPSVDSLAKQVEELEHEVDLNKIEHAKRIAKEHEETLRRALVEVGESSDEGESDGAPRHRNGYNSRNMMINSDDDHDRRHAFTDGG